MGLLSLPLMAQISSHLDWTKLPQRCNSCHVSHGVPGTTLLPIAGDDFCFQCHGDSTEVTRAINEGKLSPTVRMKNLRTVFRKASRHPTFSALTTGRISLRGGRFGHGSRTTCLDCHSGHGRSPAASAAGPLPKRSPKNEDEFEYQLCYRCHARVNPFSFARLDIPSRTSATNPSYHPIEAPGRNPEVPSLKPPYNVGSRINCTDCHNNSDPAGPRGPHGSDYEYLLTAEYNTNDYLPESPQHYALCYKCHSRESILGDESFPYHRQHIVEVRTSCATCHDAHGSQLNAHLIRFNDGSDPLRIKANRSGRLEFVDQGRLAGACFLNCHGVEHAPRSYLNLK